MNWKLIWTIIHLIDLILASYILQYLNVTDVFACFLFTGILVTLLANIFRKFTANASFHFTPKTLFWCSVNTFTIYLVGLIMMYFEVGNVLLWLLCVALGLMWIGGYVKHWYPNQLKLLAFSIFLLLIIYVFPTGPFNHGACIGSSISKLGLSNYITKIEGSYENLQSIDYGTEIPILSRTSKSQDMASFDYINQMRVKYGLPTIQWDERAYNLAMARVKDMDDKNYFDHTSPTGDCPSNMKSQFGFTHETVAENLWGTSGYSHSSREPIDSWMDSRGHRANLLYPSHVSGAIACYNGICAFIGVHNDPYGLGNAGCTTGEQGKAYWANAPKEAWER